MKKKFFLRPPRWELFLTPGQTETNNFFPWPRLRRPLLSLTKQIPIKLLLGKMTTHLTQPATTFLSPKLKNLSKTTATKLYPAKKWETTIRKQCIKNKCLHDYIYFIATLQCKVCLMFLKTECLHLTFVFSIT